MRHKIIGHLILVPFMLIGYLLIYMAFDELNNRINLINRSVVVQATITRVDYVNTSKGSTSIQPVFAYTFNNKKYEKKSADKGTLISYPVGGKEFLWIDPAHPDRPIEKLIFLRVVLPFLILLLGGTIFGGYISYILFWHELRQKYFWFFLKNKGERIEAMILKKQKSNLTITEKQAIKIIATWTNPRDSIAYVFVSCNTWNENLYDKEMVVWIDPKNPKRYWIDMKGSQKT
jgi:hypothetical protein